MGGQESGSTVRCDLIPQNTERALDIVFGNTVFILVLEAQNFVFKTHNNPAIKDWHIKVRGRLPEELESDE